MLRPILFLVLVTLYQLANAHFALAPKLVVEPLSDEAPDAALLKVGDATATRADFMRYLQRITAFDTKYDRLQPSLYAHISIVRGIAFLYPENVHSYVDKVQALEDQPALHQAVVARWFERQLEIFAALRYHYDNAIERDLADESSARAVLDFYAAGAKTEFLEELVVLGTMPATVDGLREFAAALPGSQRRDLQSGAEQDSELTPPEEQERMKQRWVEFRRDLMARTGHAQHCGEVDPLATPEDTVVARIGAKSVTLGQVFAVFGRVDDPRRWAAISQGNCARLVLYHAAARLLDELDLVPERVHEKIAQTRMLFLAGMEIASELGTLVLPDANGIDAVARAQALGQYPTIETLKDTVIEQTGAAVRDSPGSFLDREYVRSRPWRLQRTLAPQHSIHL